MKYCSAFSSDYFVFRDSGCVQSYDLDPSDVMTGSVSLVDTLMLASTWSVGVDPTEIQENLANLGEASQVCIAVLAPLWFFFLIVAVLLTICVVLPWIVKSVCMKVRGSEKGQGYELTSLDEKPLLSWMGRT